MTSTQRQLVFSALDTLRIPYECTEHPAVFTIGEMDSLGISLHGNVCKNLFLRDSKGRRHFLVVLGKDKRADLDAIQRQLGCSRLSFASADRLERLLGLHKGEVTPFGVLNDRELQVEVAFDRDLEGNPRLGVHPNENTATVWIAYEHLRQLIEHHGNAIHLLAL